MKRLFFLCLVVWALCMCVNAQLLYEISGNGLAKPSYLFGTHHLVSTNVLTKVPGVFRAFNDCDAVVGEFVDDNDEEMQQKTLVASKMEQSIKTLLSDEELALVDEALQKELGLNIEAVEYLRPNMIAMIYELTVSESLEERAADDVPIDSYFQLVAKELGKKVYGLETVDEQLDMLFRAVPLEQQAKNLMKIIKNSDKIVLESKRLDDLYVKGDLEGLYRLLIEAEDMTEAEKFLFVDERNIAWTEKISNLIKTESCFIAVGALHLPGKEGLINLLKKAGYRVKAVNS